MFKLNNLISHLINDFSCTTVFMLDVNYHCTNVGFQLCDYSIFHLCHYFCCYFCCVTVLMLDFNSTTVPTNYILIMKVYPCCILVIPLYIHCIFFIPLFLYFSSAIASGISIVLDIGIRNQDLGTPGIPIHWG